MEELKKTFDGFCKEIEDGRQVIISKLEGRYEELQGKYKEQINLKKALEDKNNELDCLKLKIERLTEEIRLKDRSIQQMWEHAKDTTITDGLKNEIIDLKKKLLNKEQEASFIGKELVRAQEQLEVLKATIQSKEETIHVLQMRSEEAPRISRMGIKSSFNETNPFKGAMSESQEQSNGIERNTSFNWDQLLK